MENLDEMRDQAVRVSLGIPVHVVAKMARVSRFTVIRYEISPAAVMSGELRGRIGAVYKTLRGNLAKHPLRDDEVA